MITRISTILILSILLAGCAPEPAPISPSAEGRRTIIRVEDNITADLWNRAIERCYRGTVIAITRRDGDQVVAFPVFDPETSKIRTCTQ